MFLSEFLESKHWKKKVKKKSKKYLYIIDQAQGQDGWILAEFSFCFF
mgnify:CR=1 FL=1